MLPFQFADFREMGRRQVALLFEVHADHRGVIDDKVDEAVDDGAQALRMWDVAVDDGVDALQLDLQRFKRDAVKHLFFALDVIVKVGLAEFQPVGEVLH
jgi:hypothetical protein